MPSSDSTVHVIVVADDAVEAGMLALDLVQAGFDAHAASDEESALQQLSSLQRRDGALPGMVAAYADIRRASVLSRRLISAALSCRFVAVASDRDRHLAEEESKLLDWTGVVSRPANPEQLTALLRADGAESKSPAGETEEGDLGRTSAAEVLNRLLGVAAQAHDRRDCVLQLAAGDRHGQVAIVDGRIVHAQADLDTGRHALERICCWRRGDWRVTWARYTGERTIRGGNNALAAAMEYARRLATARDSVPNRNCVCTVRWERVRPLPVVAEAMFHRIASGQLLERALDGEGDDELEAFAALVSRMRRGAVVPQASAKETQKHSGRRHSATRTGADAARPVGDRTETFGGAARFPMVPNRQVSAPLPSHRGGGVQRTAAYPRAPRPAVPDDALTRRIAPNELPADLPEVPQRRLRSSTPSNAILPATLPDFDSEAHAPVDAAQQVVNDPDLPRATGWFGLNVGAERNVPAPTPAAVIPPAPVPRHEPAPTVNVSESVATLSRPRQRQSTDVINAAYSDWTDDYADTEKAVEEASVIFRQSDLGKRKRSTGWIWAAALVVVVAAAAFLLVPDLGGLGGGEPVTRAETPVMATYRQAVSMIDTGRRAEAVALLSGVHNNPSVPAEALLQLAVLEIQMERYELGRAHLETYLDDARSVEAKRAKQLYAHVFGPRR